MLYGYPSSHHFWFTISENPKMLYFGGKSGGLCHIAESNLFVLKFNITTRHCQINFNNFFTAYLVYLTHIDFCEINHYTYIKSIHYVSLLLFQGEIERLQQLVNYLQEASKSKGIPKVIILYSSYKCYDRYLI